MYSHISFLLLCCLSKQLFPPSYLKSSCLISFTFSIKMTFHPWQCMNHTSVLLGLYFDEQSLFTLGSNLGSSCFSSKAFQAWWPRWHGWDRACGIVWYVPMARTRARVFDDPHWNMPFFEPEMEAGSLMNPIITQIWYKGINTGHQNQSN